MESSPTTYQFLLVNTLNCAVMGRCLPTNHNIFVSILSVYICFWYACMYFLESWVLSSSLYPSLALTSVFLFLSSSVSSLILSSFMCFPRLASCWFWELFISSVLHLVLFTLLTCLWSLSAESHYPSCVEVVPCVHFSPRHGVCYLTSGSFSQLFCILVSINFHCSSLLGLCFCWNKG